MTDEYDLPPSTESNDPQPTPEDLSPSDSQETPAKTGTPLKSPPVITVRAPSAETIWQEIMIALNYLTRFNFSMKEEPKPRFVRKSMGWFPLIGVLIGFFGASIDWVMTQIGLPGLITAAFAVISMLWMTRAMHEEEFATLANAYGHTLEKDETIGWLREERAVQYGTLSVIIGMIIKIGAIASLSDSTLVFQALIAAACWSRAMMVVMAGWLRPIEGDPVADNFQQPPLLRIILALFIGTCVTFLTLGSFAPMAMGIGAGVALVVALLGANHLRGYNGPLMGTLQVIVEVAVLGYILSVQ
ncbi:MAG: adenosylcobinamide-GDP ribazoletransferase [Bdellovibrionales bacterium]